MSYQRTTLSRYKEAGTWIRLLEEKELGRTTYRQSKHYIGSMDEQMSHPPRSQDFMLPRPAYPEAFSARHRASPYRAVSALAEVLDTIDDAFCICDSMGRIQHENPAFRALITRDGNIEAIRAEARRLGRSATAASCASPSSGLSELGADLPGRISTFALAGRTYRMRVSSLRPSADQSCPAALVSLEAVREVAVSEHVRIRHRLTPREVQVVELLAEGHSNERVAETLGVSIHTARHHTGRVLSKLQARGRSEVSAILRRLHR